MKIKVLFFTILFFQIVQITGQLPSDFSSSHYDLNTEGKPEKTTHINNNPNLIFNLNVANDMLFFTDQYFSSGIELNVYAPFMAKSPFNKILIPNGKDALNYYAITFTHNMYTPIYIDTLTDREIDHPFASYILFGNRKESFNLDQSFKITSEFQLGVIGSLAGGQVFMNTMHDHIAIAEPVNGWENQINNDLCFQYSALLEKGILDIQWLELNAYVGGRLGIPHTEAQLGMYLRFGYFDDYFQNIGINKDKKWKLWLFCAGDANFVAYNAVLQGGLFNRDNSNSLQSINPVFWHTRFGGTLVYKTVKIEIAQDVISPSFPTAQWHRWTTLSLMLGF